MQQGYQVITPWQEVCIAIKYIDTTFSSSKITMKSKLTITYMERGLAKISRENENQKELYILILQMCI